MDTNERELVQEPDISMVKENVSKELSEDTDELQEKIDELDDELDDIIAQKRNVQNKKAALDKKVQMLNKEKKKQQRRFRKLKRLKRTSVFFSILVAVGCVVVWAAWKSDLQEEQNRKIDQEKASELEEALNPLIQQKEDLQDEIVQLQEEIAKQETAKFKQEADSQKAKILSHSNKLNVESTLLTEENKDELDAYVASLRRYPDESVKLKEYEGISYYEVVQKYDLGQYMLSDSGNTMIYPGAVLRGDSLMKGIANYSLAALEQTPLTLVCSQGGNSVPLENISYGTVQKAVEQLWKDSNPEYSENWQYTLYSAQSEEELNFSLGVGYGGNGGSLGVSHTETASTIAITFTETYFSIAAEPLSSATQYFQTGSDLKGLGDYEPVYVSSVDYGRRIVVMATTELTEDELKAKLSANIQGVDIGADIGYIKKNIDSNCKIYCYGGDSAKTLQSIDSDKSGGLKGWWDKLLNGEADNVDGFNQMITADDSLINPLPLAYHLNYLSDNSAVPASVIINDNVILADTAKLVTISLEGNVAGTFRLSDAIDAIGYVVDTDWIQITKKGNTSGEIQFIWDSSQTAALTAFFNDNPVSYQLSALQTETDNIYCLDEAAFNRSTSIHINISDAVYEIQ